MTVTQIVWLLAIMLALALIGVFALGYYCGREDAQDTPRHPRRPEQHPYREPDDFDRWLLEFGHVPALAPTQDMPALEPAPAPVPADLGSLDDYRAAMEARTTEFIRAITAGGES